MDKDELFYLACDLKNEIDKLNIDSKERRNSCVDKLYQFVNNLQLTNITTEFFEDEGIILLSPINPSPQKTNLLLCAPADSGMLCASLLAAYLYFYTNKSTCSYNLYFTNCCNISADSPIRLDKILNKTSDIIMQAAWTQMNPCVAQMGQLYVKIGIDKDAIYSAEDENPNVIYMAMPVIAAIRSLRFPNDSPWLGAAKAHVLSIEGNADYRHDEDYCIFDVWIDTTDSCNNEMALAHLKKSLPPYCVFEKSEIISGAYSFPVDHPLVQRLIAMGREPFGEKNSCKGGPCPYPVLALGPGTIADGLEDNTPETLDKMREAIEIYISILR